MITAVILAAGKATRMGKLKQILPWQESTILETVISNVAACKYIDDEIRVILGAQSERVKKVLSSTKNISQDNINLKEGKINIIVNNNYEQGMFSSVLAGLHNLPLASEYVMIIPGDQPLISTDTIDYVAKRTLQEKPEILIPTFARKRGHPLIFTTDLIPEVYSLPADQGLRSLFQKYPDKVFHLPVEQKEITIDLDYYDEYQKYRELVEEDEVKNK